MRFSRTQVIIGAAIVTVVALIAVYLAGLYPALRAANENVIVALRYE
jgi:ABC-type lipoprotein release transport system permease subunit